MPIYNAIVLAVRRFAWIVPDETGWRIGGHKAWLHTFVTESLTCYVIEPTGAAWPKRSSASNTPAR